eukprot:874060-Rhodomonas_salina.5
MLALMPFVVFCVGTAAARTVRVLRDGACIWRDGAGVYGGGAGIYGDAGAVYRGRHPRGHHTPVHLAVGPDLPPR